MVYSKVIERYPSGVAVHGYIMAIVKKGGDREVGHEKTRVWNGSLRASDQLATMAE